jgi:arylformamidase
MPMSDDIIYRNLTQAGLDREYNNRAKVADSAEQMSWYTARSRQRREHLDGVLDVAYGHSADETLDLFGGGRGELRPVNVFFHGGYWRSMHKDDFSFVAGAFVPTGALSVVVNYSLIPTVGMDTLVAQCRRSMVWLFHNVVRYGGDPERIHASGHSAGGHLVAMLMATDWPRLDRDCPPGLVRGGLSISGLFDLEPIRLCFLNQELRLDEATVAAYSPLNLRRTNDGPLALVYGGDEGDEYTRQSHALAERWSGTTVQAFEGHNHFSIMRELDQPDTPLSRLALSMMGLC